MEIIELNTYTDNRGSLTVIDKELPFEIRRVFYIYNVVDSRGGHCHRETIQGLVSIKGSCDVEIGREKKKIINLSSPNKCLVLQPEDFHIMKNFSKDCILLVLASQPYNKEDYIYD
jgi:dTDP-4-dehydrorhamnose 3,5-epimerase-like enzyme